MGLRCLLGHDFDEPETERERNEEGNEVVVTVREVKTCKRCGEKQVVSENKEITSIDQLRESATDEPSSNAEEPSAGVEGEAGAGGWGSDELSTGADAGSDGTADADGLTDADGTTGADEPTNARSEPTAEGSDPDEDPVDRGVADIIEQAEKDDDMLQQPPEESSSDPEPTGDAGEESDDDVPVHPGQRSAAAEESETPDAESDDGVILDEADGSQSEDGRQQWEEEASPEEVPGGDQRAEEPSAQEDEDAEIIDGEADRSSADPDSEPDADEPQQSSTPSAVADEDAEIMDADPKTGGEPTDRDEPSTEPDEGHTPWPEAPGEDEGHDATAPEGEPADVDFGGSGFPSTDDEPEDDTAEPTEQSGIDAAADRANGHRTDAGESSDASATPTADVDLEQSSRDADLEYYCPECGLTRQVGNSSMRAGDICPECRVGYITEQRKAE